MGEKCRSVELQSKFQSVLNELLLREENKVCADCGMKGPRWASWNIGIFLCIRCAGFHRKMGVHISKVKSVNLDSWTAEQISSMKEMGNSLSRAIYEAYLPDNFKRPTSDFDLEQFIRSKYERKLWIAKECTLRNFRLTPDINDQSQDPIEIIDIASPNSLLSLEDVSNTRISTEQSSTYPENSKNQGYVDLFDFLTSTDTNMDFKNHTDLTIVQPEKKNSHDYQMDKEQILSLYKQTDNVMCTLKDEDIKIRDPIIPSKTFEDGQQHR